MQYRGVNHVALVCRDMAETVDFYQGVLEMPLVKTIDLPGGRGQHFFFDCGGGDTVAFFWFPNAPEAAPGIASMHADYKTLGSQTAHASMNHLAISVPLEKFDEYAARLQAKGVAMKVVNHEDTDRHASEEVNEHTWIRSMYFRDPNGIHMELAALTRPYGPQDVQHAPLNAKGERVALKQTQTA
ncbi:MAG: VOC family protein [Alphaproteobacteria bacterium]|nr:VOC family protein [Alphaproteobacteria bacterium]MBU1514336.1 VOC family protein [Alphaproteobacteria bacterium]MBU2095980.1 VOC family protein [Alphaproteobacteria bacterium]MBU2153078.1 VOC family protein [Alphaproteobacteria bacterium]MBU2308535.1 VOC family protein [Alphaproteobacteria bacterium]